MVKRQSKQFAFENLTAVKDTHSKMENIEYSELMMQDYMKSSNIKLQEALTLFKFRTRMADFGENFRAGTTEVLCPLCSKELDNQSHSFHCKYILDEIVVKGNLKEIYLKKQQKQPPELST